MNKLVECFSRWGLTMLAAYKNFCMWRSCAVNLSNIFHRVMLTQSLTLGSIFGYFDISTNP